MMGVIKVPTLLKASQYNHLTEEYHKKELRERWNHMPDGRLVQRDLYSAFLLQHMSADSNTFDQDTLIRDYPHFLILHDQCIEALKKAPKTLASMGIVRKAS